jgi:hypothetical protein
VSHSSLSPASVLPHSISLSSSPKHTASVSLEATIPYSYLKWETQKHESHIAYIKVCRCQ